MRVLYKYKLLSPMWHHWFKFASMSLIAIYIKLYVLFFFFSSRRRHTRCYRDWSSDVCSSDLSRTKGRIVATGLVGLTIPRDLFYEKELEFVVSRSSGPGIYDPDYEHAGQDYHYPYVRWTHGRNMAHFLELVKAGQVRAAPLTTHRFKIDRAREAYAALAGNGSSPCV